MNKFALWPEKNDEKKNKAKIFWCVNHADTFLFFENTTKTDNSKTQSNNIAKGKSLAEK